MTLAKHLLAAYLLISCAVAVAQPQIVVTSPNGGEVWRSNVPHDIAWSSNFGGDVWIELYRGSDFNRVISESTPNNGLYTWVMPGNIAAGNNYRIHVISLDYDTITVDDWSDHNFLIQIPPRMTLLSPNGGENWLVGSYHPITWTDNIVDNLRIDLWRADTFFCPIAASVPNSGSFTWLIPQTIPEDTNYRVRVQSLADSAVIDCSDGVFTMKWPPSLLLRSPNGSETWMVGDANLIYWNSVHLGGDSIRIDLKRTYPTGSWTTLSYSTPDTGSFRWIVGGPVSALARIRIRGVSRPAVSDTSDTEFMITDALQSPQVVIYKNHDDLTVAWRPVGGANRYRIWASQIFDGSNTLLATTTDTSLVIENMTAGYQIYQVVAER
jgi:hypothetical protein